MCDKKIEQEELKKITELFHVNLKKKADSFLMQVVSWILKIFFKFNRNDFMNGYITTVFNTIYYTKIEHLTYAVLVHEITHVQQYKNMSFIKYITKDGRTMLECEAFCAEIEFRLLCGEKIPDFFLDNVANMLYSYGIGRENVEYVKKRLKQTVLDYVQTKKTKSKVAQLVCKLLQKTQKE